MQQADAWLFRVHVAKEFRPTVKGLQRASPSGRGWRSLLPSLTGKQRLGGACGHQKSIGATS